MKTITQFPSWFSKQKLSGKLTIGCAGLLVFCCLCSVPYSILNPSTPAPLAVNTSVAEVLSTPLATQFEKPNETPSSSNASEPTATLESYISLLNCNGGGNNNYFCLATGALVTEREKLESALSEFCEITKNAGYCDIHVWADEENIPVSYPMTDSQLLTRLAIYKKNENTSYICFILYKDGNEEYVSNGCSK